MAEILAAYGPDHCLWASDWPHLRARQWLDIGALLKLFDTPFQLLGFQGD